jgi:hypothetical protein
MTAKDKPQIHADITDKNSNVMMDISGWTGLFRKNEPRITRVFTNRKDKKRMSHDFQELFTNKTNNVLTDCLITDYPSRITDHPSPLTIH